MKIINHTELQARIASNVSLALLEALPEKYYRDGHLPGAILFPHDQVKQLAPALLHDKEAEIVVYCASATCQNSHIAAKQLIALGYGNVAVYAGGKKEWSEAGLVFEKNEDKISA